MVNGTRIRMEKYQVKIVCCQTCGYPPGFKEF